MSDHPHGDGTMPLARLAAILEAYGAEPRRWPPSERAAAEALIAGSPEARALRDDAARLDALLAGAVAPAPSAALRAAILQAAPQRLDAETAGPTGSLGDLWRALLGTLGGELGGWRQAGAVIGVTLLLGIATGGAVATQSSDAATAAASAEELDFVQLALFDDPYAEY